MGERSLEANIMALGKHETQQVEPDVDKVGRLLAVSFQCALGYHSLVIQKA